ncbi:kinesin light chain [Colletotrichum cuscutae]|uniref:Kinesin light chain n=1 Tax=Colletotrichum cuscutae TaxID=1209917 RepID=A0AAI9UA41_9PEZI|nr:kinesin light chain [Colletotrichum cuscutae]
MVTIYSSMGYLTLALDVSGAMVETQAHNGHEELFFEAIQLRSDILGSLSREQEAKQALAALIAILPQESISKFSTVSLLAELYLKSEDYREARDLLVGAIAELKEDDAQSLGEKAFLKIQLSMAIANMDCASEAQETFSEASKLVDKLPGCSQPSDMAFNNNLARMFISQGESKEAERLCRQFLPKNLADVEASNTTIEILGTLADAMGK